LKGIRENMVVVRSFESPGSGQSDVTRNRFTSGAVKFLMQ
jgi:hypothetical protein